MASVFRPQFTRIDPATGRRVRVRVRKWYVQYRDANGVLRRVPGYTDKAATQQLARDLEREAAREAVGLPVPGARGGKRALAELVVAYRAFLTSKGNTPEYVHLVFTRITHALEISGMQFVCDLSGTTLSKTLARFREHGIRAHKQKKGISNQTSNFYLSAMKSFGRWLVRERILSDNPFAYLDGMNVRTDRRHDRRALSAGDLSRLIEVARTGPAFRDLSGPDRAVLYLAAANTGLRAAELKSLTVGSFDLDHDPPTVTVQAGYSKRRRKDVLPLHPELVAALRPWLSEKLQSASKGAGAASVLWPGTWIDRASRMVKADLERAEIPYRDDDGLVFDFHAFRHQCLSSLVRSGVHPRVAQSLARHSTITLTMDRYAHIGLEEMNAALKGIPPPCPSGLLAHPLAHESDAKGHEPAPSDNARRDEPAESDSRNALQDKTIDASCHRVTRDGGGVPGRS